MKIKNIEACEILDSRGNPTVETTVELENGIKEKASVPSGASTGTKEAIELRDGDEERFGGKGVLKACENVNGKIADVIRGMDAEDQQEIDQVMLELDGTENKANLGANAILSVSLACARAAAVAAGAPLWKYIREKYKISSPAADKDYTFPVPLFNVVNGGAHADSGIDIQECMIVPVGFATFEERFRAGTEIYQILLKTLAEHDFRVAVGAEGGFAPRLPSNEDSLKFIVEAIEKSKYELGSQIKTGMDAAASEFYDKDAKKYNLKLDEAVLDSKQLLAMYQDWNSKYPLELIEDPMSEFDWEGWTACNKTLGAEIGIVGDDLTVTNKKIIEEAHEKNAINTVLIKVNQIGSLTEAIESIAKTREHGMKIFVSHRSGETTDEFIGDLAVAVFAEYIKFGAPARGERVCKYNRVLEIERMKK